jgi:aryl-alcohol dehydrogenase-like predicted oxidoreductase
VQRLNANYQEPSMIKRTLWNEQTIPALGLGCWAIGGPFYSGQTPLGWGKVDDSESIRAIHCALDIGLRFFDTAPAYGCGHSEEILGRALSNRTDAVVSTKIGFRIDAHTKQIDTSDDEIQPQAIQACIEASLQRLNRERIDVVHLHLNSLPTDKAASVFDTLAAMRQAGKIDAYGWSTDYPDQAAAFADRPGFVSIEHAMNVFFRASDLVPVIEQHGLLSINRSPLAMGLLSGSYSPGQAMPGDDIRSQTMDWMAYFKGGTVNPVYAQQLDEVRELLCTDGRSLVQGALAWLWARSPRTLPIPGFRMMAQVKELAGALDKGPLPAAAMQAIERAITREPEGVIRDR